MSRQLSWQHLLKPVALVAAYFACLAGMVYLMDRVETARAEARVIGWTQSLVWESLDAPAYARFTQPIVEPTEGTGWNLTGEIRVPDRSGTYVAQPYRAKVRIVCSPSRNRDCWELTGLSVGDESLAATEREISSAQNTPAAAAPTETPPSGTDTPLIEDTVAGGIAGDGSAQTLTADAGLAPPKTAVDLLEARLSALSVDTAASPEAEASPNTVVAPNTVVSPDTGDPFGQSNYRHAGLDNLESLEAPAAGQSAPIATATAAVTPPDGYPPIPPRKPL